MPKGKSRGQAVVRVANLERTMDNFTLEMSKKYTMALFEYHNKFITPEIHRISKLERMDLYRIAGLLFFYWVDWRLAMGLFFIGIPGYARQTGKALLKLWVKLVILTTWEISDEEIEGVKKIDAEGEVQVTGGWQPKWYQGLARRLDTDDGFIYKLKPIHWFVRWYDSWTRVRAERKLREAAQAAGEPTTPTLVEDVDGE